MPARSGKGGRGKPQLSAHGANGALWWRYGRTHKRTYLNSAEHEPTAVFGPGATIWYKALQKNINLKSTNATIAARVLVDQTVFASTNLFLFLSSMAYMEGTDPKEKLQSTYPNALIKNWMVWPAVQAINFKLVPLEHRVLVVNIVSLGWNCYLSYINSKKD